MIPEVTADLYDVEIYTTLFGSKIARGKIYGDTKHRFEDGTTISTSKIIKIENGLIYTLNSTYRYSIFPKPKPKPECNDMTTMGWLLDTYSDRACDDPDPITATDFAQVEHLSKTFHAVVEALKKLMVCSNWALEQPHHHPMLKGDVAEAERALARLKENVE